MFKASVASVCAIVLWFGCKRADAPPPQPVLQTDSSTLTLGIRSGSQDSFSIHSNVAWNITFSPSGSWLRASLSSGNGNARIIVTATSADSADTARRARIQIAAANIPSLAPLTIQVTQLATGDSVRNVYGGTQEELFYSTVAAAGGGFISVGYTASDDGDVTSNHGAHDLWIVRTDTAGKLLWQRTMGGSGNDYGGYIIACPDGGYLIAGSTNSNDGDVTSTHGGFDGWVIKIDGNGNTLWQKTYGGLADDYLWFVTAAPGGGYILAGQSNSFDGDLSKTVKGPGGWVMKLDGSGNVLWSKSFGHNQNNNFFSAVASPDGGWVLCGQASSNSQDLSDFHGAVDYWVVKVDSGGNNVWQHAFGGSGSDIEPFLVKGVNGGYLVAGTSSSNDGNVSGNHGGNDVFVVRIDESGNISWAKSYGGSAFDEDFVAVATQDGNYLVGGNSQSSDGDVTGGNRGGMDAWLFELDDNGNILWQKSLGGTKDDYVWGIIEVSQGNFAFCGQSASNDGDIHGAHGNWDAWLMKFNK